MSHLFYFDFVYHDLGRKNWFTGWAAYEFLIILTIFGVRMCDSKSTTKFVLSDLLLMFTGAYGILIHLLSFICMINDQNWMNVIYAASAPAMYAFTIFVLSFPTIYKLVYWFKGYKEYNDECSHSNSDIFSAKWRSLILGN